MDKNNKKMDQIFDDIYDTIDCHFTITLFLELKKKMSLSQPYWTPLKVTIDYFISCLKTYPTLQKNHRLKYALLNQLVNIPYFEYHSIPDMLSLFQACKYQTHPKGKILKYSFNSIIIMLRGKIIFNYQPGDQSDLSDGILPEEIRNFRKKLETNIKVENFED